MNHEKIVYRKQSDFDILKKTTKVDATEALTDTVATHGIVNESVVDILFEIEQKRDKYDLRSQADRRVIRVKVWSRKRPELNSYTHVTVTGRSRDEMARACEFAAAALAERQCGLYGDNHNLVEVAKAGRRHFLELCDHLASRNA